MRFASTLLCLVAAGLCAPAAAQQNQPGTIPANPAHLTNVVEMKNAKGEIVGTVQIRPTANGTLFTVNLMNLPPGGKGFHVHAVGRCDPPGFTSAGDHYNPGQSAHGFDMAQGAHAGDLPNVYVSNLGTAIAEFHTDRLTLEAATPVAGQTGRQTTGMQPGNTSEGPYPLLDEDGSAIIVHANPDNYRDVDSAGARIACGVISRR